MSAQKYLQVNFGRQRHATRPFIHGKNHVTLLIKGLLGPIEGFDVSE
jgi:hypothetical protein